MLLLIHANLTQEAIGCLSSRRAGAKPSLDEMRGSDGMVGWLKILGHSVSTSVSQCCKEIAEQRKD